MSCVGCLGRGAEFANLIYSGSRFAMAGRDMAILLAGMSKQAAAFNELSNKL